MRGCYASVARFKHAYCRAEDELLRAERTTALRQGAGVTPAADLHGAWRSMLFSSFHDIPPGSSIERAFDEQIDEVGGIRHTARQVAFAAANQLARRVRISLPAVPPDHPVAVPFVIWNPHLEPLQAFVEIEAGIDHRPVWSYRGRPRELPLEVRVAGRRAPFQEIAAENDCGFGDAPWRKRVLAPVGLPAAGWTVATVVWVEGTEPPVWPHRASGQRNSIRNDFYRVAAVRG
jgi:alpha-mannosidase